MIIIVVVVGVVGFFFRQNIVTAKYIVWSKALLVQFYGIIWTHNQLDIQTLGHKNLAFEWCGF